jgi:predicted phosphohydrolase
VRIVCISDTHGLARGVEVPGGDVLVHAGDLSMIGAPEELAAEADWLRSLPHPHKVVVAGNHDFGFERTPDEARALFRGLTYLEDEEALVAGLRVYGSPWQPEFGGWAFNLPRGKPLREKWERIPRGIDVLVTHGPPQGVRDATWDGRTVGCADLVEAVRRVRPRLHVFGHIHEGYGRTDDHGLVSVNASLCTAAYRPTNPPVVVDLR